MMMRVMLYEAAPSMLRSKKWSWLKAWAMQIARRRGDKKGDRGPGTPCTVIMHRIWVDGTEFPGPGNRDGTAVPCRIKCDQRKVAAHRAVE